MVHSGADGLAINATLVSSSASSFSSVGGPRARVTLSDAGLLRIEDLQPADAGVYTCEAGKDDQFAAWTAHLAVASPTNPNVVFVRRCVFDRIFSCGRMRYVSLRFCFGSQITSCVSFLFNQYRTKYLISINSPGIRELCSVLKLTVHEFVF